MVKQIVTRTVCLRAHGCWCLFLIHTFLFCESTCCCPVLSSSDRHGGNQRSDIFVKKRMGGSGRAEREWKKERKRGVIHSIHMIFFFLFQKLVSLTGGDV